MKKDLMKMTKEWMQLERKTLEQRRQADEFYESNLMALIEEDFIRRNKKKVFEKADYFVISVGTSYEPIVLDIKLFSPKRILFLYTEQTEKTLNKIAGYCKLEPDTYEKRKVSETDPLDIYREIKRYYLEWDRPEKMYIDFECRISQKQYDEMYKKLALLIAGSDEDSIRIYHLCGKCDAEVRELGMAKGGAYGTDDTIII